MIKLLVTDIDGTLTDGTYHVIPMPGSVGNLLGGSVRAKRFHTRDFHGLSMLQHFGIKVAAATTSDDKANEEQFRQAAPYASLLVCRRTEGSIGFEKVHRVQECYIDSNWCTWDQVAVIGDDVNDIEIMKKSRIVACPGDACNAVQDIVRTHGGLKMDSGEPRYGYALQVPGGKGCVREFVEILLANHLR